MTIYRPLLKEAWLAWFQKGQDSSLKGFRGTTIHPLSITTATERVGSAGQYDQKYIVFLKIYIGYKAHYSIFFLNHVYTSSQLYEKFIS